MSLGFIITAKRWTALSSETKSDVLLCFHNRRKVTFCIVTKKFHSSKHLQTGSYRQYFYVLLANSFELSKIVWELKLKLDSMRRLEKHEKIRKQKVVPGPVVVKFKWNMQARLVHSDIVKNSLRSHYSLTAFDVLFRLLISPFIKLI